MKRRRAIPATLRAIPRPILRAILRAWLPAVAVLILGWLCTALSEPHAVGGAHAAPDAFSAVRAEQELSALLGPERPHPVGSTEDAALRARILARFAALGVPVQIYRAFVCNTWRGFGYIPCGTVTDVLAQVLPGTGRAVLMMAHADSVGAGPGAADDGAGVACVLEAARALRAAPAPPGRPRARAHPVLALISDGEEAGLLGAAAFLQDPALAARVGAAVNLEARGTRGASLLFQTSPGDARLLQLYARHIRASAASSLFSDIYRRLPNDTDLTLFIRAGIPSVNFAIIENVQAYHSPLDRQATLSPASLQMQGDNLLTMVRALDQTPFDTLSSGDALYVSVLGYFLPRMPGSAALPLALGVLLLLGSALWRARAPPGERFSRALWATPLLLTGSVLAGYVLVWIAQAIAGTPDPSYAHPLALRVALGLSLWLMLLLTSRLASAHRMCAAVWLWVAMLGALAAWRLPGLSPYLLWPAALASVLLWLAARAPGGWDGPYGLVACAVAALGALIFWLPLASASEKLMGLRLQAAFTLAAAVGLLTILPLLAGQRISEGVWRASVLASGAGAVLMAVIAGLLPTYSRTAPERLNLLYVENAGAALWIADTRWERDEPARLPASLRRAAPFLARSVALPGLIRRAAYVAPAGPPRLPLPQATAAYAPSAGGNRRVMLTLLGSADADEMALYIPPAAQLRTIDIRGQHLVAPQGWSGTTVLMCVTRDCRDESVSLGLGRALGPDDAAAPAVSIPFVEHRFGLPDFGRFLAAARPATAMPSQNGDEVLLQGQILLDP